MDISKLDIPTLVYIESQAHNIARATGISFESAMESVVASIEQDKPITAEDIERVRQLVHAPIAWSQIEEATRGFETRPIPPTLKTKRFDRTNINRRKGKGRQKIRV